MSPRIMHLKAGGTFFHKKLSFKGQESRGQKVHVSEMSLNVCGEFMNPKNYQPKNNKWEKRQAHQQEIANMYKGEGT